MSGNTGKTKTAEQYREEARKHLAAKEESFDRCDTDGFLSQWSSGLSARLCSAKAELVANGKMSDFVGLYDGERRLAAKLVNGQYGLVWLLREDEEARYGRKFVPTGKRSTVQRRLGLSECKELAPAWATITGSGRGLSGNVWVEVYRTDASEWGQGATKLEDSAS
jgi:hypothetical protein